MAGTRTQALTLRWFRGTGIPLQLVILAATAWIFPAFGAGTVRGRQTWRSIFRDVGSIAVWVGVRLAVGLALMVVVAEGVSVAVGLGVAVGLTEGLWLGVAEGVFWQAGRLLQGSRPVPGSWLEPEVHSQTGLPL